MMTRSSLFLTVLTCFFTFAGCQNDSANTGSNNADAPATYSETVPLTEAEPAPAAPARSATKEELAEDDPYVISEGAVLGIRPGDAIASVINAKKTTMKTGEGDFTVYNLIDDGGKKLGYLMPDLQDGKKIGSINITSNLITTPEGISVGSTFGELEEKMGSTKVHGSEIEGRTYAIIGKVAFLLASPNYSYDVDKSTIKPGTKIKEIAIE